MLGIEHVVLRLSAAMFGTSGYRARPSGTQFTCFTSTKLQLLTQKAGLDGVLSGEEKENELLALHVQKYEH